VSLSFCLLSLHLSPLSVPGQVGRTFEPTSAFVVDGLKPDTEYAFRLAARSPQGLGAFTAAVRQRTLQSSTCLLAPRPSGPAGGVGCLASPRAVPVSPRGPPSPASSGLG
jgi:netrin-G3 ligand